MPVALHASTMSENNGNIEELTTSQINQSEAGPDTVELDHNVEYSIRNLSKEHDTKTPEVLDKLIKQPINVVAPLKVEGRGSAPQQQVLEIELAKLHEMLEKQDKMTQQRVADTESQLTQRFSQLCSLQDKIKQSEDREQILARKLSEQAHSQEQLTVVMQDYEMLIGKLTAEVEADKQLRSKVEQLENEKEAALVHLGNVEAAFSDVHSKYEKCKKVVDDYKRNEGCLKESIAELREANRIKEKTLESVQTHAANQLETAQREIDLMQGEHEQELTRLRAMLRKTELKVISLQVSLDQKIKENRELTVMCDDLIAGKTSNRYN